MGTFIQPQRVWGRKRESGMWLTTGVKRRAHHGIVHSSIMPPLDGGGEHGVLSSRQSAITPTSQ